MVHRGILQFRGDLCKIQIVFPNHLLALLELDAADVFAGRYLQILVEQSRQIAGAHIHLPGNQRHGQFFPDMGRNILLSLADDLILRMDGIGGLEFAALGGCGLPQQHQKQQVQLDAADRTVYTIPDGALSTVENHVEQAVDRGTVTLSGETLRCGETEIPLEDILDMQIHGRHALVFSTRSRYYELLAPACNVLKFMLLYGAYRQRVKTET